MLAELTINFEDVLVVPVPSRRLPHVRVVADELGRNVDGLGETDKPLVMVSDADLDNPLGTTLGAIYAWRQIKRDGRRVR